MPAARGKKEEIVSRRHLALRLRQAGMTYRDIADTLTKEGFSCKFTTAYKDVQFVLAEIIKKTNEDADELRTLELTRLDIMLRNIWKKVLKGDLSSVDRALKISERRCKLLGIDAPTQNEIILPETMNIAISLPDGYEDEDF